MKFDLTKIDYTKEISEQLRKQYFAIVEDMIKNNQKDNEDKKSVTLFHGTNLYYLNSILLNGLEPNRETGLSNYENEIRANEHLVYLTNKWHYMYAYNTYSKNIEDEQHTNLNIPCYIEVKVPAYNLIIDEDFFHSSYVKTKVTSHIKKGNPIVEISYEESLAQYATVAHLGKVERKDVVSFTILANIEGLYHNFMDSECQYYKDLVKWGEKGKGKGKLKLMDLLKLEDDPMNLTFQLKDIPENSVIARFVPKKGENHFAIELGKVVK